jgi:hypothetical protein
MNPIRAHCAHAWQIATRFASVLFLALGIKMKRVLIAFLIAPLVIPLLVFIFMVVASIPALKGWVDFPQALSAGAKFVVMFGVLTYATTIAVGLPLYLVLHVFRCFSLWHFVLGGASCGVALLALFGGFNNEFAASLVATHTLEYAAVGVASSVAFYFCGVWKNKRLLEPNKPLDARRAERPRAP